jgi:hypothetical protein
MVYTADLKSAGFRALRVRVPLRAYLPRRKNKVYNEPLLRKEAMSDFLKDALSVALEVVIAFVLIVTYRLVKRVYKNWKARRNPVVVA